jgi:hypothetical protein
MSVPDKNNRRGSLIGGSRRFSFESSNATIERKSSVCEAAMPRITAALEPNVSQSAIRDIASLMVLPSLRVLHISGGGFVVVALVWPVSILASASKPSAHRRLALALWLQVSTTDMEWNLNHYPWHVSFVLGIVAALLYTVIVLMLHSRVARSDSARQSKVISIDSYTGARPGA